MNNINIKHIDLNLLVVFDVMLSERNVARAAEKLNLTPSAVSHALRRLREQLNDELFVRDGRKMIATARALRIGESLPRLLKQIELTLTEQKEFNPQETPRTFRLSAPDFIAPILPQLLVELATTPNIKLQLVPFSSSAVQDLINGSTDILIASNAIKENGVIAGQLGCWPWLVFGRENHPAFEQWSIERWANYPHLKVGTDVVKGDGPIDQLAAKRGIDRTISTVIPSFLMAPAILADTDMLLTVPSLAIDDRHFAFNLENRAAPFDIPALTLSVYRSALVADDPGIQWMIDKVIAVFAKVHDQISVSP
ncbi:LysR family transcriptional regulator [Enterovibrio norvegicus]|uniref:LysR family transcriptional regulator n=1 Tax=Enterovibrio norvegicus TaxID=188144 RepID=UPI000C852231|nr:LysR family transcriptional regulator [Enterovibrio norvegicus]PML80398.1 hypothetical protein BCT69_11550 [Enterovibrio norvegicus]